MSKRYGRKQKAAHRAKIAELTARLGRESTAHMYLPADVPELTSYARVVGYSVTESGGAGQMIERSVTVTIEITNQNIHEMARNQCPVQFMGKKYVIVNGTLRPGMYMGGPEHYELELVGIA